MSSPSLVCLTSISGPLPWLSAASTFSLISFSSLPRRAERLRLGSPALELAAPERTGWRRGGPAPSRRRLTFRARRGSRARSAPAFSCLAAACPRRRFCRARCPRHLVARVGVEGDGVVGRPGPTGLNGSRNEVDAERARRGAADRRRLCPAPRRARRWPGPPAMRSSVSYGAVNSCGLRGLRLGLGRRGQLSPRRLFLGFSSLSAARRSRRPWLPWLSSSAA